MENDSAIHLPLSVSLTSQSERGSLCQFHRYNCLSGSDNLLCGEMWSIDTGFVIIFNQSTYDMMCTVHFSGYTSTTKKLLHLLLVI